MYKEENGIMVTACCLTYNQEHLVGEALAGMVMQEVDFGYEILVHDDASTDDTVKIVESYMAKHDNIRLIRQSVNQLTATGIYPSSTEVIPQARGKYIAFCDGDDYWTDPLKLKKQVAWMEAHPKHSMCYHDNLVLTLICEFEKPPGKPQDYTQSELVAFRNSDYGIATCTKMTRNYFSEETRQDYYDMSGDYSHNVLMGTFGPCGYVPKIKPSVYRKHNGSSWSFQSREDIHNRTILMHQRVNNWIRQKNDLRWIKVREPFFRWDYMEITFIHQHDRLDFLPARELHKFADRRERLKAKGEQHNGTRRIPGHRDVRESSSDIHRRQLLRGG